MTRIRILIFLLFLIITAAQSAPVITVSGPVARIPGMTTPTTLLLSGHPTGKRVRWLKDGIEVGSTTQLAVTESGMYQAQVDLGTNADLPLWSNVKSITVPELSHSINGYGVLSPGVQQVLVVSGTADQYRISCRWFRNAIEQNVSPSGSNTYSTLRPGIYYTRVSYRYGTETVEVATQPVVVYAPLQAPIVSYSKTTTNPVSAPVALTITNYSSFGYLALYRNETLLTQLEASTVTLPGPGMYYVKGILPNGEVNSNDQEISSESIPTPVIVSDGGHVLTYWDADLELSVLSDRPYGSYTWYKNGLVVPGATSSKILVNQIGDYAVQGCVTYAGGQQECKTSSAVTIVEDLPVGTTQNVNFVKKKMVKVAGIFETPSLNNLSVHELSETTTYFDGMARPLQVVFKMLSPQAKDVVQFHTYDDAGREAWNYLPIARNQVDGKYRYISPSNPQEINQFYQQASGAIANTAYPYAETVFDASPLSRVIEQGTAGESWQKGGGHTVRTSYSSNTTVDKVLRWKRTSAGFVATTLYAAGMLSVTEITNNNGALTREFLDSEERKILIETPGENSERLRTYYVYDDLDKLVAVILPKAAKSAGSNLPVTLSTTVAKNECYQYSYDERGRVISNQVPGALPVFTVYDSWDRVVLTQDGNQRSSQKWTFIKYDALDRKILTGEIVLSGSQSFLAHAVRNFYSAVNNNLLLRYEEKGAVQHGYTNRSYPLLTAATTINSVWYYDDYQFNEGQTPGRYAFRSESSLNLTGYFDKVQGLITGTKTRILGTGTYLTTVTYYDNRYRPVQVVSDNVFGNVDVSSNQYDFVGNIIKTKKVHSGIENIVQIAEFEYDHGDRLLRTYHQINNGPRVLLSAQQYNEISQLTGKALHKVNNENAFQCLDYRYNSMGWLTGVNQVQNTTPSKYADLYNFKLSYDETVAGLTNTPQYNGNISAFIQTRPLEQESSNQYSNAFAYQYDEREQLTSSRYVQANNPFRNNVYNETLRYDANGNILELQRQGTDSNDIVQQIDNLAYTYNGNQLTKIVDSGNSALGFKDLSVGANPDYSYDANGNLTSDVNKDIISISYNFLNLVYQVKFADNRTVKYSYTSDGNKVSQEVYNSANALDTKRVYVGDIIYENDTLRQVKHADGRIVHEILGNPNSPWVYEYDMKDHLGNVRLSFTTKETVQQSVATLESSASAAERAKFLNYNEAVKVNSLFVDHTKITGTQYALRLNGSDKERYGLAKSLSVMPGDTIRAEVFAKYIDTNRSNWTNTLSNLITSIAMGTAPVGTLVDGGLPGSLGGAQNFSVAGMLDKSRETGNAPKAYLNYIVFDRNYYLVDGGYVRLSETAREYGQNCMHERLFKEIVIKKAGYVYLYLSNDNAALTGQSVEVYFDDFSVEQIFSPVVESTDYYAFGMISSEQSREHHTKQPFKFNNKEVQGKGLDWYDYGARMYDATNGRWSVIDPLAHKYPSWSPYVYVFNNPLKHIDPDGREGIVVSGSPGNHGNKLHFLETGVARAVDAKTHTQRKDEKVTWLVYDDSEAGFSDELLKKYSKKASIKGVTLKVVTKASEIVDYVNNKDDKGSREKDKITSFYYVGHSTPGDLDVGYAGTGAQFDPSDFKSKAFSSGTYVNLVGGCRTAIDDDGFFSEDSNVKQFAKILDKKSVVSGSDVRVSYSGGAMSDKQLLRENGGKVITVNGKK